MSVEGHGRPWPAASDLLWWACEEPERPPDPYIMWKDDCPACLLKARVTVAGGGPGVDILARHLNLGGTDAG
jgi:hypothetical protein